MNAFQLAFGVPPWRLSGVVYGTLLNDPAALAALGDAVHRAPYKAPPVAPVLYIKPRNTLAASGAQVVVPADAGCFEIGAALAIVIGRTACRVAEADALAHVAGYTLVADLSVPHTSFYRPSVRHKARDGSCLIGPQVVARPARPQPDDLVLTVSIDGAVVHVAQTARMRRPLAQLLADVTEFMTLQPGDVLMLGVAAGAPHAGAGQRFAVECAGIGRLEGTLVDEARAAAEPHPDPLTKPAP
jgi:5-oxopent-3-ene-1,2,5-tricarboxylate decarboxylase / 2-hydroxyhepta-2,4-diene-1,7-dioate isomerase